MSTSSLPRDPSLRCLQNPFYDPSEAYPPHLREIVSLHDHNSAFEEISKFPGYRPTPLRDLRALAVAAKVNSILYKDESARFGLGSFKALGGAYGVMMALRRSRGRRGLPGVSDAVERSGVEELRRENQQVTVTCATDGNHGRAVAWGASLAGCRCVIFLHEGVSRAREDAIASLGARIVRFGKTYDEAVERCERDARRNGWMVISDTSYPGYMEIPRFIMHGYTVMVREAVDELGVPPTHVFVQGGVGGLAAAACGYLWERYGPRRPVFVVVEPHKANCIYSSALEGRPASVEGPLDTIMAGLACGRVSLIAWEILRLGVPFFITISDEQAVACMRLLAQMGVVAGESGVAGLAGFIACLGDVDVRAALGLGERSRILLFGTEGATDPDLYRELVWRARP